MELLAARGFDVSGFEPDQMTSADDVYWFPNLVGPIYPGSAILFRVRPNGLDPDRAIKDTWVLEWPARRPARGRCRSARCYPDWTRTRLGRDHEPGLRQHGSRCRSGMKSRGLRRSPAQPPPGEQRPAHAPRHRPVPRRLRRGRRLPPVKFERLRAGVVRTAPDGTTRRRPSDAVRVVVAVVLFTLLTLHAYHPTDSEQAIVRFFNSLPDDANTLLRILYDVAALWALGLLVVVVVLLRRWRFARDLLVAGVAAWVLGRLARLRRAPDQLLARVRGHVRPHRRTTVPAGARRRGCRDGHGGRARTSPDRCAASVRPSSSLLALTAMYIGKAYPTDLLGAVVLGWGVAAAVHYRVRHAGRPPDGGTGVGGPRAPRAGGSRPTIRPRHRPARRARGVPRERPRTGRCGSPRSAGTRPTRSSSRAPGATSPTRTRPTNLFPTRRQQVEYEAYVALLARDSAARVPAVRARRDLRVAWRCSSSASPRGRCCSDADPALVTDAVLDDVWQPGAAAARRTDRARQARRSPRRRRRRGTVRSSASRAPSTSARRPAGRRRRRAAARVDARPSSGTERAVAAAIRGVGAGRASLDALPLLQPQAVSGWTHDALGGRKQADTALDELRAAAAAATGSRSARSCASSTGCTPAA